MVRVLDPPGRYLTWGQWRQTRRPRPAMGSFCATCWNQRRILEPGPLGLVPVCCPTCSGYEP